MLHVYHYLVLVSFNTEDIRLYFGASMGARRVGATVGASPPPPPPLEEIFFKWGPFCSWGTFLLHFSSCGGSFLGLTLAPTKLHEGAHRSKYHNVILLLE